ncbi:MAG: hypothetical protein OCD01_05145 [Fibrobacterales bacterium]
MINNKCEEFRSWNRLEGTTRTENLEESLRADTYDPLWMMARQHQFGEFKANDCGTAVSMKIAYDTNEMKFSDGGSSFDFKECPPEAAVESVYPVLGLYESIEAGLHITKLIDLLPTESARMAVKEAVHASFPVVFNAEEQELNSEYYEMSMALGTQLIDGCALFTALDTNTAAVPQYATLTQVYTQYSEWYRELYSLPQNEHAVNWNPERLEYDATFTLDTAAQLKAPEYFSGNLEWFNFDLNESLVNSTNNKSIIESYLPTKLTFPGMPADRWWEVEDASVDVVNIDAHKTDISKLVVSEFAAMYSNDWLVAPLDVAYGTVAKVKSTLVKDTFGEYEYIENRVLADNHKEWDLFSLYNEAADTEIDGLVMFPAISKVHDSEPIEKVTFKRDEMANMVWAVEENIPDNMGGSMCGHQYAQRLAEKDTGQTSNTQRTPITTELSYEFMSTVPYNWIPFVPTHSEGSNRDIVFRRGALPRVASDGADYTLEPVAPRTHLMNPHGDLGYALAEEEVLKGGITVVASFQRARWYNGKTINWYGYKKVPGRNLKPSGLKLDYLHKNSLQE